MYRFTKINKVNAIIDNKYYNKLVYNASIWCFLSLDNILDYLPTLIFQLSPGETYQHECGLLFLYEGEFMIDISCSANQKFGSPMQKRQRAFAIADNQATSLVEKSPKDTSCTTPLSPNSVSKKLKYHEANFWAQSFALNIIDHRTWCHNIVFYIDICMMGYSRRL